MGYTNLTQISSELRPGGRNGTPEDCLINYNGQVFHRFKLLALKPKNLYIETYLSLNDDFIIPYK